MKLAEKRIGLQTNVSWLDLTLTEIERLLSTHVSKQSRDRSRSDLWNLLLRKRTSTESSFRTNFIDTAQWKEREKGLLSLLLTPHCRPIVEVFLLSDIIIILGNPSLRSLQQKICSKICFHWFRGLIDRRTKNANYAVSPLLVLAITNTNKRDSKPQWDELWWKIFFRFRLEAKKLLVFIIFKCKIIIRA